MSYITVQDMLDAFGQRELDMIADRNQDGIFEDAVVTSHIAQAEQQINFAVGQRCNLPLVLPSVEVLGRLKQWALDITRFRLTGSSGVTVTSDVDGRYKEAREDLERVTSGKIVLCAQGAAGTGANGGGGGGFLPSTLTPGMAEEVDTSGGCCRQFDMGSVRDFTNFGRVFGNRNSK